jgi:predicted MFS family arabinose efflux permease
VEDLRAGVAALHSRPAALRLVGADVVCSAVYGAQTVLLLLLAMRLGAGGQGYGAMLAAYGCGGVAATSIAGRLTGRGGLPTALLLVAVAGAMFAVAPGLPACLVLAAATGAGSVVVEVLVETGLQRTLPDEVFVRAYGFALPASLGGIVAGSLLAPALVGAAGLSGALVAVGVLVAGAAGWLAWAERTGVETPSRSTPVERDAMLAGCSPR